jgi:hypothetical protein
MSYLPLLAVLLTAFIAILLHHRITTKRFNERFPPIDDDEFMRRCAPGVSRDVALRVRRIISNSLGIEYERIHPEQSFVNDLGAD